MDGAGTADGLSPLLLSLVASTVRLAAPLVLAALAGLYAERSGVVDIGLEGKMLAAAFAGAAVASLTGSAALGLAAGIATALLLALLHGVAAIAAGGDQIVSGMALNLIAAGATPSLASAWFGQRGTTPPLPNGARFGRITLPFDHRSNHRPPTDAQHIRRHRRELDVALLKHLMQPVDDRCVLINQLHPLPRQHPPMADFRRRHEARLEQTALHQLPDPLRV